MMSSRVVVSAGRGAILAAGFLLLLWACNSEPEEESFFNLSKLADTLSTFDSVLVIMADTGGRRSDTLFSGEVKASGDLADLPAPGYLGETIIVSILGYSDGRVVYSVDRLYDGARKGTVSITPKILPWASVRIGILDVDITEGDSQPLPEVTVLPENLADASLEWLSTDSQTVGVGPTHFRALKPGGAQIRARLRLDPGKQAGFQIRVLAKAEGSRPESIRLDPDTLVLARDGAPGQMAVIVHPASASGEVVWDSPDSGIIAISDRGWIRGIKEGQATVRVVSKADPRVSGTGTVRVIGPVPVDSVRFHVDTVRLYIGGTPESLVVRVYPRLARQEIAWTVHDTSIAQLEGNRIEGKKAGRTLVTVRSLASETRTDTLAIWVVQPSRIDSLVVEPDTLRLYLGGGTRSLKVSVLPEESPQDVIWTSTSEKIAASGSRGDIAPLAPGKAHIVATSRADSSAKDSCLVFVVKDTPRLYLGRADTTVAIGSLLVFTPVVRQEYGGISRYRWDLDGDRQWDGESDSLVRLSHQYGGAGTVLASFHVEDTEGNDTTVHKRIRIVDGPPVLILSPPDNSFTHQNLIPVVWTVNGVEQKTFTQQPLVEGPNTIVRTAKDSSGNVLSASITVTLDTRPPGKPQVRASTPTNDPTPAWYWLSGGSGGNGVFRIRLDAQDMDSATQTRDTLFSPTAPLSEGDHVLHVQERDEAGNWSETGRFILRVDLAPPDPPVLAVSPVSPTSHPRPSWSWRSAGTGGAGIYRYRLDDSVLNRGTPTDTSHRFQPAQDLIDGSHTFYIQEMDTAGNWSRTASRSIEIDITPPPAPKVSVSPTSPTATRRPVWTWEGGTGGAREFRFGMDSAAAASAVPAAAMEFSPSFDLPEGDQVLFVQERDSLGNWSPMGSASIRIDLTPPGPPKVRVTAATASSPRRPTWAWSAGEGGMGEFRFKVGDSLLHSGAISTRGTAFTPDAPLAEGLHLLHLQERDAAGNWSPVVSKGIRIRGQVGYAAGYAGQVFRSEDGGVNWVWRSGGHLRSVHFTGAGTGFAAGEFGTLLKTLDGGVNWIPLESGTDRPLYSVRFTDEQTGHAVGAEGTILSTRDGGTAWTRHPGNFSNRHLTAIAFSTPDIGCVVGNGIILRTVDGGATWSAPDLSPAKSFHAVHFSSRDIGYVAGDSGAIFKTTDGGRTWAPLATGVGEQLLSIEMRGDTGFAVGQAGRVLRTTNAGSDWEPGRIATSGSLKVHMTGGRNAWVINSYGQVWRTTNAGAAWTEVPSGSHQNLEAIHFADVLTGYIVGQGGTVLKTLDGGATWTTLSSGTSFNLFGMQFTDAVTGFAVGDYGTLLRTVDGGRIWAQAPRATTLTLQAVHFPEPKIGYAVGASGAAFKSTDAGRTWTALPSFTTFDLWSVHFIDPDRGFASGAQSRIYATEDGGRTWSETSMGTNGVLRSLWFTDGRTGFAAGYGGSIFKTADGGGRWTKMNSGTDIELMSLHFADDFTGLACGYRGTLLRTTDAGETWATVPSGTLALLNSVQALDGSVGFAAGASNTLLRTMDAGATWNQAKSKTSIHFYQVHFP